MLQTLQIKDLVIVESLMLEFAPGMTTLTGETGAGKSIMIDALGLALGEKADSSLVRSSCKKAEVSASFSLDAASEAYAWLNTNELTPDDEDCILRRVVTAEGRSRAFINGSQVTIGQLREFGEYLVDIHGQHAHQSLLKRSEQLGLVDRYAGHQELLSQVASLSSQYKATQSEYETLRQAADDRASRIDYLNFQLDELDTLAIEEGELDRLEEEHRLLSHMERLEGETSQVSNQLTDDESSLLHLLSGVTSKLSDLTQYDAKLIDATELLESAQIQIEEAASSIRNMADSYDADPARLAELDQRLADIHDMARKHRINPDELPSFHENLRKELGQLDDADSRLDSLKAECDKISSDYHEHALKLRQSRELAAGRLAKSVTDEMQRLGMKGGVFDIQLSNISNDRFSDTGLDQVDFQVSANPGQPTAPLNKVASGGELSRISLAIQVSTAGCGSVPTLIFDEVDVGIGGATAEIVGQLLRKLGDDRQVICVTHLPQVASQGHQHFRVQKSVENDQTRTSIKPLNEKDRVEEIARMLGGVEITDQTRAHASEMIDRALNQ